MANENLLAESSSLNNFRFRQVEKQYLEHGASKTDNVAQKSSSKVDTSTQGVNCDDSIVSDIVKARKIIQLSLASVGGDNQAPGNATIQSLQDRVSKLEQVVQDLTQLVKTLTLNKDATPVKPAPTITPASKAKPTKAAPSKPADDDDDDVDLFGSGDEDDAAADELRQKRVEAYNQKKSKKPAVVAKSSIVLDIKPWDDETNMDDMQALVRTIVMDGLVWGAAKYVPLAYGIKKLQIVCVIEDDKISVEELSEKIESFENHVQSVDIAAFNKV